mmetsp:Transcript_6043/g.11861  ORF Transcript_6043/g.11861 Transcript_6043/m.11861 type:complete len:620 (-) Transcript_6043:137-1996(-)
MPNQTKKTTALTMSAMACFLWCQQYCRAFAPAPSDTLKVTSQLTKFANISGRRQQKHVESALAMAPRMFGDGSGKTLREKLQGSNEDEEWHPRDVAKTTPQLMHALWGLIADGAKNMKKGDTFTVIFPEMEEKLSQPTFVSKLLAHLDACKDVCDNFGINTILIPYKEPSNPKKIVGFTVKSYRNPNMAGTFYGVKDASEMKFAPDPFWSDDEEWDFSGLDDEDDDVMGGRTNNLPEIEDLIPKEDDKIVEVTKRWVDKMMADLALCPFTKSAEKSGIPMGPVRYAIDRATTMEDAYVAYWNEVCRIEGADQDTISTTLQILPEFCMNSVEMFEQWADTLTGTLEALGIEELLQLIFFHPQWTFRDGGNRSGSGLAANYARRSPWPMVNILRTKQVRTAQKGIPTGLVYQQNEKTLGRIGTLQLEKMLRLREWSDIEGMKVDRKDMEALRVAQDLQVSGAVRDEDISFMYDSTPAANKVDRSQINAGNMVNVIRDALEIRLGKKDGKIKSLDGAQTSAAMMASDFLLEELDFIAKEYPGDRRAAMLETEDHQRRPLSAMAKGGYGAAYGFGADEYDNDDGGKRGQEIEHAEMNALFGGGIPMSNPADENPRGMDIINKF